MCGGEDGQWMVSQEGRQWSCGALGPRSFGLADAASPTNLLFPPLLGEATSRCGGKAVISTPARRALPPLVGEATMTVPYVSDGSEPPMATRAARFFLQSTSMPQLIGRDGGGGGDDGGDSGDGGSGSGVTVM
jgi:hypothetical protein